MNTSAVDLIPPESSSAQAAVLVVATESLSVRLKMQTASLHSRLEELLGLPAAIRNRPDYEQWLGRFLGFYEPLESALAAVPHSGSFRPGELALHSHRLVDDLRNLAISPSGLPRVPTSLLPLLPTFAHVAGARYVLIGATLGGRHILRGLEPRLRAEVGTATRFLEGGGPLSGSNWLAYRDFLDEFGSQCPDLQVDVVTGAMRTFAAFHQWFIPFCAERNHRR